MSLRRLSFFIFALCCFGSGLSLPVTGQNNSAEVISSPARPQYHLQLDLDYQLLTFSAKGKITVPVAPGESLRDAVFFIYANAPGVSGNDGTHKNIVVDEVKLGEQKVEHSLNGAVLRVKLPQPQANTFALDMKWRGVVPRAPAGSGGLMDAMGGMDLSGLLGGGAQQKKDPDYGVYSYGNGVLSLGSFWYPSLAVRQNGKWMDEAPGGVGDVGFSEASDFSVNIVPRGDDALKIATPAGLLSSAKGSYLAGQHSSSIVHRGYISGIRDFAILASNQFVTKSKQIEVSGKLVRVSAFLTKAHEARADEVLDIAVNAIEIYSKRFGPYPYSEFKVVEGPMRGGAGGMEFSGMVSIASFLFGDMDKQMNELAAGLGLGNIDKMMSDLGLADEGADAAANPAADMLGGMLGGQKAVLNSLLEMTIAHEVAHQWWAMGVGSDAQRAPWVDESLTNYSAIVYFEDRYGKAKAQEMLDTHLKGTYSTGRMLGGGDAPVNLSTASYKSNLQYGAVVYGKGALFFDALRTLVGDEAFFGATREYFQKYNGRIAPPRGLLEIMKTKSPGKANDIEALYSRWIEGTHGDEDITGGKVAGMDDLLGGMLGGIMGGFGDQ